MTAPIPEEQDQAPVDEEHPTAGDHDDLPDADDAGGGSPAQEENAETSQDQPSQ
ncbi:MAG: hypothetical protein ACXVEC_09340 [Nocardioides sp.]